MNKGTDTADTLLESVTTEAEKKTWLEAHSNHSTKQLESAQKKMDKAIAKNTGALHKLNEMKAYDSAYGYILSEVAGVDEAGRGPLAGPVVAAAVVMPIDSKILYIDDSKKLTEAMREKLYLEILDTCIGYGVGIVGPEIIDAINILEATKKAMTIALENVNPQVILIDAVALKTQNKQVHGIIKGDEKSYAIACASIIAKVTRDHLMLEYHKTYPEFGFNNHKGYGTREHYAALDSIGPSKIHRQSFLRKWSEACENKR